MLQGQGVGVTLGLSVGMFLNIRQFCGLCKYRHHLGKCIAPFSVRVSGLQLQLATTL